MYPSRGNNAYGQQQQQQSYSGQNLGPDGGRHAAMLSGHPSSGAHYGGQYSSVYGSMALSSSLQAPGASAKGSGPSGLDGRTVYGSTMQESPTYASGDYSVASQKYGIKGELSDYPQGDRRQYVERTGVYSVRDSQNEPTVQFADSVAYGHHQHQADVYDHRLDAATAHRKELFQARTLQAASIEGSSRQADFLAVRHSTQELLPYSGRMDSDPNTLSVITGLSHRPSILGAAPRRDVDDLVYTLTSTNSGYGVSLPPGRDYGSGKGLHSTTRHEPDYILSRAGYSRLDDRKDRDEERERERRRDREKERERERERQRERERERERERKRERDRREKETERVTEIRRERTPPRISRDRGGSSRVEASHRRRSPDKEKRRDYVCKVYSSSLVDVERDYLSIDKRYPRLFASPECSKVIVNWSRDNLKVPLNVPVSFDHDFIQYDAETQLKEAPTVTMVDDSVKSEHGSTQWNAKVILMSGLSRNALEELSSERDYDDRIPHFCNMLRFACLRNGNSLIAIGGLWETLDGNDPSDDKSTLIQTALRHAKDLTGLDLKNCQHWNPFLEIHYDRVGKNGLFSHKEVTVLYIPDLLDCLPSVDAWTDQWLAHKKAIAERERLHALKKVSREKKEGLKDKEPGTPKDLKKVVKTVKKKAPGSSGPAPKVKAKVNTKAKGKAKESGNEVVQSKAVIEQKDEGNTSEKKDQVEKVAAVQKTGIGKNSKKRIIRKALKKKVAAAEDIKLGNAAEQSDALDPKKVEQTTIITTAANSEAAGENNKSTGKPKTFTRKKVIKKVPVKKEDEGTQSEVTPVKEQLSSENKPKNASGKIQSEVTPVKEQLSSENKQKNASGKTLSEVTPVKELLSSENTPKNVSGKTQSEVTPVKEQESSENKPKSASRKTIVMKKIIKKVMKRKVVAKNANNKDKVAEEAGVTTTEQSEALVNQESEVKLEVNESTGSILVPEVNKDVGVLVEIESNRVKEENKGKVAGGSSSKTKIKKEINEKSKDGEKSKVVKVRKDKDGKVESMGKEVKEKKQDDEIPRHPGLILQTKESKDSKLRSLSLSLDSLLGYDDNDVEESTFELSLFAETFYEMLQYQMGSRILTFLQKLRIKFLAKRNQKKRQLEESSEKEKVKTPAKRAKTEKPGVGSKSVKTETPEESQPENEKDSVKVENMVTEKPEGEEDLDEEPEEDLEEDEDMTDVSPKDDEEKAGVEKMDIDAKSKNVKKEDENVKKTVNPNIKLEEDAEKQEKEKQRVEIEKKENIDKELLQAFRFFDRNRVGHIRVEDMRLIIHNLGNFLSHRDVKDLVQSALLESNTGRDDRILYNKLVRMEI